MLHFAAMGHPLAHALSPTVHAAFGKELGIQLTYEVIDVGTEGFIGAVHSFFANGGTGINVTAPHKRTALALSDEATTQAHRAGSCNTLSLRGEKLVAENTDGAAFVRDLTNRKHVALRHKRILIIGAGGAARGISLPLLDAEIAKLTVVNRTMEHAEILASQMRELTDPSKVEAWPWSHLTDIGTFDIVIDSTSAGIKREHLDLSPSIVSKDTYCYTLNYGDAASAFLNWARSAGTQHVSDGLGMLVESAADAFTVWHHKRPTTDTIYDALVKRGVA